MINAATKLITSLQGLLEDRAVAVPREASKIDDIRYAMLNCLGADGRREFAHIERRLKYAPTVASLWYLRPELLMALSSKVGERAAREQVDQLSEMFDAHIPEAMRSRPAIIGR
jgi:hypothetical protein